MLPDRVSNPGPLIYESGALPIALRGPASAMVKYNFCLMSCVGCMSFIQGHSKAASTNS